MFKSECNHVQWLRSHTRPVFGTTRKLLLLEFWGISVSWTMGHFNWKVAYFNYNPSLPYAAACMSNENEQLEKLTPGFVGFGQNAHGCEDLEGSCVVHVPRDWGLVKTFHISRHLCVAWTSLQGETAWSLGSWSPCGMVSDSPLCCKCPAWHQVDVGLREDFLSDCCSICSLVGAGNKERLAYRQIFSRLPEKEEGLHCEARHNGQAWHGSWILPYFSDL